MNATFQVLTQLSIDPFRLDDFLRDPDALIAGSRAAPMNFPSLALPTANAPEGAWSRCASCFDPGSDPLPDPDVPSPESRS
jgi:hypothetical protein